MDRRGRPDRDARAEGRAAGGRHQGGGRLDPGPAPEERPGRRPENARSRPLVWTPLKTTARTASLMSFSRGLYSSP